MAPVNKIVLGDNLYVLRGLPAFSVDLVYIDPPFNTGRRQHRNRIAATQAKDGTRAGFGGRRYKVSSAPSTGYEDTFYDFHAFMRPRLEAGYRILKPSGSFFLHMDYREVHYCKIMMDEIFGRECFMNEIIWAYDFGARSKTRWSAKHDNILWYVKDPKRYTFKFDEIDRIPYMAPGLVGAEKAAKGKTPTDVFWHTIVPTNGKEKTGYATQKPLGLLQRIVKVHSNPGDLLCDYFAGSGSLGEAAGLNNRSFTLIDNNPDAVKIMRKRLESYSPLFFKRNIIKP